MRSLPIGLLAVLLSITPALAQEGEEFVGSWAREKAFCGNPGEGARFSRTKIELPDIELQCSVGSVRKAGQYKWVFNARCDMEGSKGTNSITVLLGFTQARTQMAVEVSGLNQALFYEKCAPAPTPASSRADEPAKLIRDWGEENDRCRGGFGDNPETMKACNRREKIGERLEKAGFCMGDYSNMKTRERWFRCKR